jgi:hypothetical protein
MIGNKREKELPDEELRAKRSDQRRRQENDEEEGEEGEERRRVGEGRGG